MHTTYVVELRPFHRLDAGQRISSHAEKILQEILSGQDGRKAGPKVQSRGFPQEVNVLWGAGSTTYRGPDRYRGGGAETSPAPPMTPSVAPKLAQKGRLRGRGQHLVVELSGCHSPGGSDNQQDTAML